MASQGLPGKFPITRAGKVSTTVPDGTNKNDTLRWDAEDKRWKVLPAPPAEGTWFHGVVNGVMQWVEGDADCAPEEE